MASLTSYHATLALSFSGTIAGQQSAWTKTYVKLAAKSPAADQVTLDKTGNLVDLDAVLIADSAGVSYERRGKKACTAAPTSPGTIAQLPLEPADLLSDLHGAVAAGAEPVDGTPTDHYTFDEHAVGLAGQAKSTGEAWIATTGGYVVKYALTTIAKADYFGDGIEGTLTWNYSLTEINTAVVPPIPPDCPAGLLSVPQLPDAADLDSEPGVLSYTTAASLADTAAFYSRELPKSGWKQTNEPTLDTPATALDFAEGSASLTVSISTDAGVTTVTIVAGRNDQ